MKLLNFFAQLGVVCVLCAQACLAAEFQQIESYTLTSVPGHVGSLQSAATRPWLLVRQDAADGKSYWLLDLTRGLIAQPIGDHLKLDSVVQAQWSGDVAIFGGAQSAVVFNPLTKKTMHFTPSHPADHAHMAWVKAHNLLVYQTEILGESSVTKGASAKLPPHSVQSGLEVSENQSFFVSAGYLDESVRIMSLPKGELKSDINVSGWFRSNNINSVALLKSGVVFSTSRKSIHWLPLESSSGEYSIRPCATAPLVQSLEPPQADLAFYQCPEEGRYGLIRHKDFGEPIDSMLLGKSDTVENIRAVYALDDNLVLVIVDGGKLRLHDASTGKLIVEQKIDGAAELAYLPAKKYLLALAEDKQLQVMTLVK